MKLALAATVLTALGCSGSSSSSSSSSSEAIGVSGTLSVPQSAQGLSKAETQSKSEDLAALSVNLSDYSVTCSTMTAPIQTGTGTVGSDGSFKISISGAKGQPLSCYLVDSSGSKAADFLIEDSSSKDMNGKSSVSSSVVPTGDLSMGTISFDPTAGEVTVPVAQVASAVSSSEVSATTLFDPTGSWTIGAVNDMTLPAGVRSTCTAAEQSAHTCDGPPDGMTLYLKRWTGVKTSNGKSIFGLQVWDSPATYQACGEKVGLSSTQKTEIGVDFSANGSADAPFTFASSVSNFHDQLLSTTGTVTLTDNWKMSTAKTQWSMDTACGPGTITLGGTTYSNAWKCGPDSGSNYQINLGGGCVATATNKPVQVENFSGITCGSVTTSSAGVKSNTCSGTASVGGTSTAVTCTNKWAVVNASGTVQPSANFDWSSMSSSRVASGTLCSAMPTSTNSQQLAQLQCYANHYWQSGMADTDSACLPRIRTDWSVSNAADFVIKDFRPNKLVFFDEFKPLADGSGGTMLTREENYEGVQAGENSWINCRVIKTGGLTIKKLTDSKLLVTYTSSEITASTSKPACLAKFNGSKQSFVFYLVK